MGLFDLFRAKWKHSDPEVRAEAVRNLSGEDLAILTEVAKRDRDARVRKIAIKRLEQPRVLLEIAQADADEGVRTAARDKAVDLLMALALGKDPTAAVKAVGLLDGARDLAAVARRGATADARTAALARVTDEKLLLDVALKGEHDDAAGAAAARVSEPVGLEQIAQRASSRSARSAAKDKLPRKKEAQGAEKAHKVVDKTRRARLLQVCVAAEAAVRGADLEAAEAGLAQARADWDDIGDDAADDKLRQRFTKLVRELEVRKVQAERDAKAKAAKEAQQAAARKADSAARKGEAASRAGGAAEREPAAAAAPAAPAPAPTPEPAPAPPVETDEQRAAREAAAAERAAAEAARAAAEAERLAAERAAHLKAIEKVVEGLERRAAATDIKGAEGALRSSHETMRKIRRNPDADEAALRDRLVAAQDKLTARISEHKDAERWKSWANLPRLEELCKEAEALAEVIPSVEDKRRAPALLKDLNERWRSAAKGAPSERSQALWERFKKACDQVHDHCREFFAKLDEERGGNAQKKEELCVRLEALVATTDGTPDPPVNWKTTGDAVKQLQEEWRGVGPTERAAGDALWKRFRTACDTFFARRDAQDKERDAERAENLRRREEICAKVEELAESTDWRPAADAIKQLQEEWKTIGEGPRGTGGPLWRRFRAACDRFFEARNAAMAAKDEERAANLQRKLLLCEKVEALAAALDSIDDRDEALRTVKAIQAEWRTIGPVPRADSDEVWRRFRAACDTVYDASQGEDQGPDEEGEPPPPDPAATGVSGFVNRLPLEGLLGKIEKPES